MQRYLWFGLGSTFLFALFFTPLSAQDDFFNNSGGGSGPVGTTGDGGTGPVGSVTDGADDMEDTDGAGLVPGEEEFQPYEGPIGRVDERIPHPACETCFTVPGLGDGRYRIFEKMETDLPEGSHEIIRPRAIPNPAPPRVNEVREEFDEETGEEIWYIGRDTYVGPTDEENYWYTGPDGVPMSLIELQRIKYRHYSEIMDIPGVHGYGIGEEGFNVLLLPELAENATLIPRSLEGVPVVVEIAEIATRRSFKDNSFRPVPSGAGIAVHSPLESWFDQGTLGPHVVRNKANIGKCCQIWSLTAGHVIQPTGRSTPIPGTRPVYQPSASTINVLGYVAHMFRQTHCAEGVGNKRDCNSSNAPVNETTVKPDIAAIDHVPYGNYNNSPFNHPSGTDPIRRLQYGTSRYVAGPSGQIIEAKPGHKHKIWGSRTLGGPERRVAKTKQTAVTWDSDDKKWYKECCFNHVEGAVQPGDSGALVTYSGTGRRHVAGVLVGSLRIHKLKNGRIETKHYGYYIPASDIQDAFRGASVPFDHYWGTKDGKKDDGFREPATNSGG